LLSFGGVDFKNRSSLGKKEVGNIPVYKNDYPILEYDTEEIGIIRPNRGGRQRIPAKCLMTFFAEVLDGFVQKQGAAVVNYYPSEMRRFPIYRAEYKGTEVCLI